MITNSSIIIMVTVHCVYVCCSLILYFITGTPTIPHPLKPTIFHFKYFNQSLSEFRQLSLKAAHHFCKTLENSTYFRAKIKRYPPFFYFQLLGTVINVMLTGNYNFNHELYLIHLGRDKVFDSKF